MASTVPEVQPNGELLLTGELVFANCQSSKESLLLALSAASTLDVDLSGVTRLDTAGVQLLLMLQREAAALGKTLNLKRPSAAVKRVSELLRLSLWSESRAE